MDIIVHKYGGSSLAEDGQLRAVAARVAGTHREGHAVAVVVSARGDTTDRLLAEAGRLNVRPARRELDLLLAAGEQKSASLLALALQEQGVDALALTGPQAGVRTCGSHLNARIRGVTPEPILQSLQSGRVVVIAGFQGAGPAGEITTLGRGGSDTTAVAIAAALGALRCEIYSDVDGVYSADPRLVPTAEHIGMLGLAEMKAMAHHGAGVLNERAIDYALEHGVTLHARRAHGEGSQTVLRPEHTAQRSRIAGVASHRSLLCVDFTEETDAVRLRGLLGGLEVFTPELASGGRGSHLVHTEQLADVPGLTCAIERDCGRGIRIAGPVSSVSAVGLHAGRDPEAPEFARRLLEARGVEVYRAFATAHAVTCLIDPAQRAAAMGAFHATFRIRDTAVAHVA